MLFSNQSIYNVVIPFEATVVNGVAAAAAAAAAYFGFIDATDEVGKYKSTVLNTHPSK